MWKMTVPWYEPAIRGIIVYFFILFIIKFLKKKKSGEFSPYDFMLLLIMSGSAQNAITGNDHSLSAGLISISVMSLLNIMTNALIQRFRWLERMIEGKPEVLILNGKIHNGTLKKGKITNAELFESLREHDVMNLNEVKCAILEADGRISVIKYAH